MSLIDEELTRESFEFLGPDVAQRLLAALRGDLDKWAEVLMSAWDSGDSEAIRMARHSIKGVCGNFGAEALSDHAAADLSTSASREAFHILRENTLAAIAVVASETAVEDEDEAF